MSLRSKCPVLFLALLALGASGGPPSGSVYKLSCNGGVNAVVDAPEYTLIKTMTLKRTTLSIEVEYGLRSYALKEHPDWDLSNRYGLGYALDRGSTVVVHPDEKITKTVLTFTFYGLSSGKHDLRIGVADAGGTLAQANSYCFSTPGSFVLHGDLYL